VVYVLNQSTDEGNVFIPLQPLVERSTTLLEVDASLVPPAVERLEQEQRIQKEVVPLPESVPSPASPQQVREAHLPYGQQAVYLMPMYRSEIGAAERLAALAKAFPTRLSDLPPAFVYLDPALSEQQQSAIRTALGNPVSVLTGGPGTGKTTCLKALIAALEAAHKRVALASPTGRAAKRLSQATERPASTIHRLLGFTPGEGFKHNQEQPLDIDFLVLDETSMLDLPLANSLLKALRPGTHLMLVGDVDQLPSVGAGDVLRDVIASGIAPVTRLDVIFRQAAGSHIITNAHRINRGEMPLFPRSAEETTDFYLFPAESAEEAAQWVQDVTCTRIPQKFGLHPVQDIQVLAPMYRGPAGVHALNARLQAALNPGELMKPEKTLFGQTYRPGDKVMQIQNNYDKEVYNGDIGAVFAIDPVEHTLTLDFEGRAVVYDWMEADQITLAYAVSIHKAQGSEFPAVVIPLLTQHYMMLQRNLIYTAITRARRLCVLVGSRKAIGIAVRNNQVAHRFTALDWRLQKQI
jgi:exodeoxyribonuclease V alpha subunit